MDLLGSINKISQNMTGKNVKKLVLTRCLDQIYNRSICIENGKQRSEQFALALILQGKTKKADEILKITRALPTYSYNLLLLLISLAESHEHTKMITTSVVNLKSLRREVISSSKIQHYGSKMTFEDFMRLRFGDIRNDEVTLLPTYKVIQFLNSLLSGMKSDYATIVNNKFELKQKIRFEYHTIASSNNLISKFIEIGNNRIKISQLLRNDTFSYEIRRHLTKFDAYVSTLSNNSPAALLTKIRPFAQVFEWFIHLLNADTFSKVHELLKLSSQTKFKLEFSLTLWSAAFETAARPLYSFAFATDMITAPQFPSVLACVKDDVMFGGELLRFLRDSAPSHPMIDLAEEFLEAFLCLENRLDEYKVRCERAIGANTADWKAFHERREERKREKMRLENEIMRCEIRKQKILKEERLALTREEKEDNYRRLQKEAEAARKMRQRQEKEEAEEKRRHIEEVMSSKAANPLMRPLTAREQELIQLEKLDLFKEFRDQMRALGASEEKIMQFFPDLSLPSDETEALNVEEQNVMENEEEDSQSIVIDGVEEEDLSLSLSLSDSEADFHPNSNSKSKSAAKRKSRNDELKARIQNESENMNQYRRQLMEVEAEMETPTDIRFQTLPPQINQNSFDDYSDDEFIPGPPLLTIPAIFHRLIVPSFKVHHDMVSKAVFALLKARDRFDVQLTAIRKLFLVQSGCEMDRFVDLFTSIPYKEDAPHKITGAFRSAAEALGFNGSVSLQLYPIAPQSVQVILEQLDSMAVVISPDPIIERLLPPTILDMYVPLFRLVLLLKLAKAAVSKLWQRERDSYFNRPGALACLRMSHFVASTETYIYGAIFSVAVPALESAIEEETVEEHLKRHRTAVRETMDAALASDEMIPLWSSLKATLSEIVRYAFGPTLHEAGISYSDFESNASLFASTVHRLNTTFARQKEKFDLLDTLFGEFISNEDDE